MEANTYNHLEELGGSEFEIVKDEPNIIGWDIKDNSGKKIGKVSNLLFDPQSRKVRYLVVNMNGNELHLDADRKVLIPIGVVDLYRKGDRTPAETSSSRGYDPRYDGNVVILPGVSIAQLNALPLYEKNHLSPHIEMAIRNIFDSSGSQSVSDVENNDDQNDFYRHRHFDDDRFRGGKDPNDQRSESDSHSL